MGSPWYMRSVVDRPVVTRRIPMHFFSCTINYLLNYLHFVNTNFPLFQVSGFTLPEFLNESVPVSKLDVLLDLSPQNLLNQLAILSTRVPSNSEYSLRS